MVTMVTSRRKRPTALPACCFATCHAPSCPVMPRVAPCHAVSLMYEDARNVLKAFLYTTVSDAAVSFSLIFAKCSIRLFA